MKKFKFESGQVVAKIQKQPYSRVIEYTITFIGDRLWGWGISSTITKAQYQNFNQQQAKLFAEKVAPMLSVFYGDLCITNFKRVNGMFGEIKKEAL